MPTHKVKQNPRRPFPRTIDTKDIRSVRSRPPHMYVNDMINIHCAALAFNTKCLRPVKPTLTRPTNTHLYPFTQTTFVCIYMSLTYLWAIVLVFVYQERNTREYLPNTHTYIYTHITRAKATQSTMSLTCYNLGSPQKSYALRLR